MASVIGNVLREGILASLTGGWYFDLRQNRSNRIIDVFHVYLFILFFALPLVTYVYFAPEWIGWSIQALITGMVFVVIKLANAALHHMYDTSESYLVMDPKSGQPAFSDVRRSSQKSIRETEGIELRVLSGSGTAPQTENTTEDSRTRADWFEDRPSISSDQADTIPSAQQDKTYEVKIDVHRKNSSESDKSVKLSSVPPNSPNCTCGAGSKENEGNEEASVSSSSEAARKKLNAKEILEDRRSCFASKSRLSECSRQFSISVPLREYLNLNASSDDPTTAKSMQLPKNIPSLQDIEKGLVYWKQMQGRMNFKCGRPNCTLSSDDISYIAVDGENLSLDDKNLLLCMADLVHNLQVEPRPDKQTILLIEHYMTHLFEAKKIENEILSMMKNSRKEEEEEEEDDEEDSNSPLLAQSRSSSIANDEKSSPSTTRKKKTRFYSSASPTSSLSLNANDCFAALKSLDTVHWPVSCSLRSLYPTEEGPSTSKSAADRSTSPKRRFSSPKLGATTLSRPGSLKEKSSLSLAKSLETVPEQPSPSKVSNALSEMVSENVKESHLPSPRICSSFTVPRDLLHAATMMSSSTSSLDDTNETSSINVTKEDRSRSVAQLPDVVRDRSSHGSKKCESCKYVQRNALPQTFDPVLAMRNTFLRLDVASEEARKSLENDVSRNVSSLENVANCTFRNVASLEDVANSSTRNLSSKEKLEYVVTLKLELVDDSANSKPQNSASRVDDQNDVSSVCSNGKLPTNLNLETAFSSKSVPMTTDSGDGDAKSAQKDVPPKEGMVMDTQKNPPRLMCCKHPVPAKALSATSTTSSQPQQSSALQTSTTISKGSKSSLTNTERRSKSPVTSSQRRSKSPSTVSQPESCTASKRERSNSPSSASMIKGRHPSSSSSSTSLNATVREQSSSSQFNLAQISPQLSMASLNTNREHSESSQFNLAQVSPQSLSSCSLNTAKESQPTSRNNLPKTSSRSSSQFNLAQISPQSSSPSLNVSSASSSQCHRSTSPPPLSYTDVLKDVTDGYSEIMPIVYSELAYNPRSVEIITRKISFPGLLKYSCDAVKVEHLFKERWLEDQIEFSEWKLAQYVAKIITKIKCMNPEDRSNYIEWGSDEDAIFVYSLNSNHKSHMGFQLLKSWDWLFETKNEDNLPNRRRRLSNETSAVSVLLHGLLRDCDLPKVVKQDRDLMRIVVSHIHQIEPEEWRHFVLYEYDHYQLKTYEEALRKMRTRMKRISTGTLHVDLKVARKLRRRSSSFPGAKSKKKTQFMWEELTGRTGRVSKLRRAQLERASLAANGKKVVGTQTSMNHALGQAFPELEPWEANTVRNLAKSFESTRKILLVKEGIPADHIRSYGPVLERILGRTVQFSPLARENLRAYYELFDNSEVEEPASTCRKVTPDLMARAILEGWPSTSTGIVSDHPPWSRFDKKDPPTSRPSSVRNSRFTVEPSRGNGAELVPNQSFNVGTMLGTHLADSATDTSTGAIHMFMDETGSWMTYSFDERGTGSAVPVDSMVRAQRENLLQNALPELRRHYGLPDDNGCTLYVNSRCRKSSRANSAPNSNQRSNSGATRDNNNYSSADSVTQSERTVLGEYENPRVSYSEESEVPRARPQDASRIGRRLGRHQQEGGSLSNIQEIEYEYGSFRTPFNSNAEEAKDKKPAKYYLLKVIPFAVIKVGFERLSLLAALDHNRSKYEIAVAIVMFFLVSILGAVLLYAQFYKDLSVVVFCFVMAGCHYSLMKSVQPDASSPIHGFNRLVAYSRPAYFIFCSCSVLSLTQWIETHTGSTVEFYGIAWNTTRIAINIRYFFLKLILWFPVVFTLGLFPQLNTFGIYILEQIERHFFGGSAVTSLRAGIYCLARNVFAVTILFGFAYAAFNEPKGTQYFSFSVFVAMLTMTSYQLSRSTSDPLPVIRVIGAILRPDKQLAQSAKRNENGRRKKKSGSKISKTSDTSVSVAQNGQDIVVVMNDDDDAVTSTAESEVPSNGESESESSSPKTPDTVLDFSKLPGEHQQPDSQRSSLSKRVDAYSDIANDTYSASIHKTVMDRMQSDALISIVVGVFIFGIHSSSIFTVLQPDLNPVMWGTSILLGFYLHYILPQARKQLPWLCLRRPLLYSKEMRQYEAKARAEVTNYEKIFLYLSFIERNVIYPVMFISCITSEGITLARKIGPLLASLVITLCGLKCLRLSFSQTSTQYWIVLFCVLFFKIQGRVSSETFVVDYFFVSIAYYKVKEVILKLKFVFIYIAPWQITWGSAFHAFAQPFSLPHSALLFAQIIASAILSSPLYPFLGSALFLISYPRPLKFWEKDYNTRRVDHSNTKMASHLDRNLGADDNNLNSLFYENLMRELQSTLCGDLTLGRWGEVSPGDCFVLASDNLNCLIHLIEVGNGLVTFQIRGLEFKGTYCQQREVEAITDGMDDNDGFCCCKPGHLPFMLSLNAAFNQRWLAWEVTSSKYIVEGYSISDNPASSMLLVYDFRKIFITYYVKSAIYYCIMSSKLEEWLESAAIQEALRHLNDKNFLELDVAFNMNVDEDFDFRHSGITRNSFCNVYYNWLSYCNIRRKKPIAKSGKDSQLVTFCLALSLLCKRTLSTAANGTANGVEFFLYGLHTLFKGDLRISSTRDEWVFIDVELLHTVVAPAVKMGLKLHQDHFLSPDEYDGCPALFLAIQSHQENLVIAHEGDPIWREAVLAGKPSLLAFRRVMEDANDDYKVIMLNKRFLSFRVIKLNRECVRGLWAGQQQELIFLRNRNPERGSIQNARQVLRNIINSSCDQPIGYPIFVSPLTTSYIETHKEVCSLLGGSVTIASVMEMISRTYVRIRKRCGEGCFSVSSTSQDDFGRDGAFQMTNLSTLAGYTATSPSILRPPGSNVDVVSMGVGGGGGSFNRGSSLQRATLPTATKQATSLVTLASLLAPPGTQEARRTLDRPRQTQDVDDSASATETTDSTSKLFRTAKITDASQVHDAINLGRLIDVVWPDEEMRYHGGRSYWKDWVPEEGMVGQIVHCWVPNHANMSKRSTFDRTIVLLKIDDKYVPISETGIRDLGSEV